MRNRLFNVMLAVPFFLRAVISSAYSTEEVARPESPQSQPPTSLTRQIGFTRYSPSGIFHSLDKDPQCGIQLLAFHNGNRTLSESGAVTLGYRMDAEGKVLDARIDKSSGSPRLDNAALNALQQCKFQPLINEGGLPDSWVKIDYELQIYGTSPKSTVTSAVSVCRKPSYPAAALFAKETGVVTVSFLIDVDAMVLEGKVDSSSGYSRLDEAAVKALALCKFRPAFANGKPEKAWARIEYEWAIEGVKGLPTVQAAKPAFPVTSRVANPNECKLPDYPESSLRGKEAGVVTMGFLIDIDGKVLESRVESSSGYFRLDEAALKAFAECKYRPALIDGKPERSWTRIEYPWVITVGGFKTPRVN